MSYKSTIINKSLSIRSNNKNKQKLPLKNKSEN